MSRGVELAVRSATCTTVGLALGLTWWLINRLFEADVFCTGEGCLGVVLLLYPALLVVCALLGHFVLTSSGLPHGWLVAMLGPMASGVFIGLWPALTPFATVASVTGGYLVAGLVSAPVAFRSQ
ncbi:hypothetical protein [Actinocrispum sp. NPDC049592]|uniref:hypothetical protein n=1 Tax=Actinocrispum sp. NPDC049592 TaxID=3154835 RepID=UPI003446E054